MYARRLSFLEERTEHVAAVGWIVGVKRGRGGAQVTGDCNLSFPFTCPP